MKDFKKYQHIVKMNDPGVSGILNGVCFIFPKIDGTNASVWLDRETFEIKAGSRTRELSLEKDNGGFYAFIKEHTPIKKLLSEYPYWRIYGEWLIPHTIKYYNEDAWRKFYIFDIVEENDQGEFVRYVPYDEYFPVLDMFGLLYVPVLKVVQDSNIESVMELLDENKYLLKSDVESDRFGEGIVIKNYNFVNRFGRIVWGKLVRTDFKNKGQRTPAEKNLTLTSFVESDILQMYLTEQLIEKEAAKIKMSNQLNEDEWDKKLIPRLIETMFYVFITEELYDAIKKFKNPLIDFKVLKGKIAETIKSKCPQYF